MNSLEVPHNWIFLRGLARSHEHWGPFKDAFQKRFPNDSVEWLDTAGNGTEFDRPSFLSIEEYMEDLRLRSGLARYRGNVHLVCVSMGAMIGACWANRHERDLASLTLVNTSDGRTAHFYERLQMQNFLPLLKIALGKQDRIEKEKAILQITCQSIDQLDFWAQNFARTNFTSAANAIRQLIASARYQFPPNRPEIPVQIIAGLKDQLVDPVCSFRLASQWGLKVLELETGPHDLPLSNPDWLCDRLNNMRFSK